MRFDSNLLAHVGDISGYPQVDEWVDLCRMMEDVGYAGVWIAEHHFAWDTGVTPTPTNPLLFGAHVASVTQRMRIGQCGVNLAANHPLRVAEDAAMLDHLSHGRMEFGFMKGLSGKVSHQFDPIRAAARDHDKTNGDLMWDSFEVIKKFWSGKPFRHDGPYFTFPTAWDGSAIPKEHRDPTYYDEKGTLIALRGLPTPVQKPIPPCWVMVDSVYSTAQAAAQGVGAVGWAQTFEGTRERVKAYWESANKAKAAGTLPAGANLTTAMMRPTYVARSSKEAEAVLRPAINGLLSRVFGVSHWLGKKAMLASWEELTDEDKASDWFDFLRRRKQFFCGTPEEVTDLLQEYEEDLGMQHLMMYWAMPHISYEQQKSSVQLFAEKVIPRFKNAA